ncbi:MAG: sugar kinase [Arenibacterium sp.]
MLELVFGDGGQASIGVAGDTYNTAVYLARDARIAQVDYVTGLGTDVASERIRAHMQAEGIGHARIFSHPTRVAGLYAIETDAMGERSFTYWRSEAAARCLGDPGMPEISNLISGLDYVFLSGISLAILRQSNRDRLFDALAAFRLKGGVVAFDSNYRPRLWNDPELARRETERAWLACDIALPSLDDEMALFGEASEAETRKRFEDYGLTCGALKRGAQGPVGLDGSLISGPIKPVHVVDTTAAGDSFNASFLAEIACGGSVAEAMQAGHALASRVIGHRGAIIDKEEASL